MFRKTLRSSDLRNLSEQQVGQRAEEFMAGRPQTLNGVVEQLDQRIAAFEKQYEMSSATMRKRLASGEQKETQDICLWSMLLSLREKLEPAAE
jgi:hypothetical protein